MIIYCDEVGTGALCGPVIVCAVADNGCRPVVELRDSKGYSQKQREELYEVLSPNLIHAYGAADVKTIARMNVYYARFEAMRRAVMKLMKKRIIVDEVIIDGNAIIPNLNVPQQAIIKADEKIWCCSAASILAKVKRDRSITALGEIFKGYEFHSNKGYMAPNHLYGVIRNGLTPFHRRGFKNTEYCEWERKQFLKSGMVVEEFIEFVKTFKKQSGKTRYSQWIEDKKKKHWEIEW